MDVRFSILLLLFSLLSQFGFTQTVYVDGIISDNTTFFYRKLPVVPSVRATIEFSVCHRLGSVNYEYPIMGIDTTYPEVNIRKRCSNKSHGQLRNEILHPFLRVGRYRTTTCKLVGVNTVNCRGRVNVQDYIPRTFYLSFGFICDYPSIYSLRGLRYNISFTKQSNETSNCIDYSAISQSRVCNRFYKETSLPNLVGDVVSITTRNTLNTLHS